MDTMSGMAAGANGDTARLTICSVIFKNAGLLRANANLTNQFNTDASEWLWLAVDNSGASREAAEFGPPNGNRFVVVPGTPAPPPSKYSGSYHHGTALNLAIARVTTRFALILDPDFYIVRSEWIRDVLDYMISERVAVFGAPWHPRWYRKYRHFPCVHCMFIDLDEVPRSQLDFTPDLLNNPSPFSSSLWQQCRQSFAEGRRQSGLTLVAKRPVRAMIDDLRQRLRIGTSRDTGYQVYRRLERLKRRVEVCQPVFRPAAERFLPDDVTPIQTAPLAQRLLPERWCYLPTRPGYFSEVGFRELGSVDITALGWEEFLWRGDPFGFHLRSSLSGRSEPEQLVALEGVLSRFASRLPSVAGTIAGNDREPSRVVSHSRTAPRAVRTSGADRP
jgi:hypothetical protein